MADLRKEFKEIVIMRETVEKRKKGQDILELQVDL